MLITRHKGWLIHRSSDSKSFAASRFGVWMSGFNSLDILIETINLRKNFWEKYE